MAAQTEGSSPTHSPDIVGHAFVEQYYQVLHETPELVHKFYQDSSVLSRPGSDGVMESVTTMKGINDKITTLDYKNYNVEILTADAQFSHKDGVLVLVTGCLSGRDNIQQKFTQTFFLAPQEKGYFVLNDVLRYLDEQKSARNDSITINDVEDSPQSPEPTQIVEDPMLNHTATILEKDTEDEGKDFSYPVDGEVSVTDVNVVSVTDEKVVADPLVNSNEKEVESIVDTSNITVDAPKKSYASVVTAPSQVNVFPPKNAPSQVKVSPPKTAPSQGKASPAKSVENPNAVAAPVAPVGSAPSSKPASEGNNDKTAKGYSVHVRNLPFDATPEQLEVIFKKFGPIKRDGIQVRGFKHQASCFGFVEFESSSSMEEALEESFIFIGKRKAYIEEKKRDSNVNGRFPAPRGGIRIRENLRNRENFGGGRGYGRNEYEKMGGYSSQIRAANGRGGVHQNGIAHEAVGEA